jgi:IclR family acetate operon transcriptional repressor
MQSNYLGRGSGEPSPSLPGAEAQGQVKFKSARRMFRIIDLVREQGEGLTAKRIAREIGVNLSSCYYLINILIDEKYIEKIPHSGGYKLGPVISRLYKNYQNNLASRIGPVIDELAQRAKTHVYLGLLSSDGLATVAEVKSPPKSPSVRVVKGFEGASHALALGKVLLASTGIEGVRSYVDNYGLEPFTPRTIIHPVTLATHLGKVRALGVATDLGEFAEHLSCVSAPIKGEGGKVEGAIGLSTTTQRARSELRMLVDLVRWAGEEASALLSEACKAGRKCL